MNITIVGGGNIGTQFAVHCAEKQNKVVIFSTKPELFDKEIKIVDENNNITHKGTIDCATNSPEIAFSKAELIFITVPAFMMKETADIIEPYFRDGMYIALIPGTGGGECAFKKAIEKGVTVFGLQRVPAVARLKDYGKIVCATGYRSTLHVAAIPNNETSKCAEMIKSIFSEMEVECLPNYLSVTMTPSNPVLHTARLKTLFDDYTQGKVYDYIPLFYKEWSMKTSELLFKCDDEVQNICKDLKEFDLTNVRSLKLHYESKTTEQLTNKMRSIKSLQGLTTPSVKVENGLIPDFTSRYFTADFPFGLEILVQIGNFTNTAIPNLKETLDWYWKTTGLSKKFSYKDYGINSKDAFIEFYNK